MIIFVDTNYLLRFFIKDNSDQHQQVAELFRSASQNKHQLVTDIIVVFEIYWVLRKVYGFDNSQIKQILNQICHLDFIFIENREILLDAINNFDKFNYDLEDAYHFYYAQSKGISKVATFDKKLEKHFKK
jgi:predicted nucleic acid-binding protein